MRPTSRLLMGLLTLLLTSLVAVPATAASAITFGAPHPLHGALLDTSPDELRIEVSGLASGAVVELLLDGESRPVTLTPTSSGSLVRASVDDGLVPGSHVARVEVTQDGAAFVRAWRFSVLGERPERVAGADRHATAIAVSGQTWRDASADVVVLAASNRFPDALAGAPAAHRLRGPLLLTPPTQLPEAVIAEIRRVLRPDGVVHVLGGVGAVRADVVDALQGEGLVVHRHGGASRWATAVSVAELVVDTPTAGVFLVSGNGFADAVSIAGVAARTGRPILLTHPTHLPDATRTYLEAHRPGLITVIGGPAAVSAPVADAAADAAGGVLDRIAGPDRYRTAERIADRFDSDASGVVLVSGEDFPDALTGGVLAAERASAVLLTAGHTLPAASDSWLRRSSATDVVVLGGAGAVAEVVRDQARVAHHARGAPIVVDVHPDPSTDASALDTFQIVTDRPVDLAASAVTVLLDGQEVVGTLRHGDFPSTVVFTVEQLPITPRVGRDHALELVAELAAASTARPVHVARRGVHRRVSLGRGDRGDRVRAVQEQLTDAGFWLGTPDGVYGNLTVQAVMAVQKVRGLPVTGSFDDATAQALSLGRAESPNAVGWDGLEIDKSRQVVHVVRDGDVVWTYNASTGSEVPWEETTDDGRTIRGGAVTPVGRFDVCFERDELRISDLGALWRPKYFHCGRGIAIHGSTSVPAHAASHGCVRVSYPAMDHIWAEDLVPVGTTVHVHGSIPPR